MGLGKTVSVIGGINVLLRDHYDSNSNGNGNSNSNSNESDNFDFDLNSESHRRRFKVLIVAPKSVLFHWEHELHRWVVLPPNAVATNENTESIAPKTKPKTKTRKTKTKDNNTSKNKANDDTHKLQIGTITAKHGVPKEDCDVYLINYEIVSKHLEELLVLFGRDDEQQSKPKALDVLVCDECHYLKSVDSQRTHATLGHHLYANETATNILQADLWEFLDELVAGFVA